MQLVGIDDNKGNQSVALYHLIVDKDRYVTTRPIYYITIAATPKFTHPNTSNEAVNYNLDYYNIETLWETQKDLGPVEVFDENWNSIYNNYENN